jgi:hypothetical protein
MSGSPARDPMPHIDHNTLLAIRQNRWVCDCIHMSLRRQSGGPDRYVGGGSIRQTARGELEFVLYDTKAEVTFREIVPQGASGEWLTPSDFWQLRATDVQGYIWEAEWVDAATTITAGEPGAIVRGSCDRIKCTSDDWSGTGSGFRGFAPTSRQVPTNAITETVQTIDGRSAKSLATNLWKVDCGDVGALLVTQLDDGIEADLTSEQDRFPTQMDARLAEGLAFVLAAPIEWLVEQENSGNQSVVTIKTRARATGEPRVQPPLNTRMFEARSDCGAMLARWLAYVLAHPPEENARHPLALSIAKVLRASAGALEDESLALATEVESLVRTHFEDRGAAMPGFITAIADVLTYLAQWTGPSDVRERVMKAVNGLTGTNPRTALKVLAKDGVISDRHVRGWEGIRHQAAHGIRSSRSGREVVAMNDVVHQLLLVLVCRIIGYDRRLTDYTTVGWPLTTVSECVQSKLATIPE